MNKEIKQVSTFFILTILLSYLVFWGPIALFEIPTINFASNTKGPIWAILLFIIGGFVPSIVGIILTGVYEGKQGIKALLKSTFSLNIGVKWVLVTLLITIYLAFSLVGLNFILGGDFNFSQFILQLGSIVPLIILGPLSEELGWRGFATKRLLKVTNANINSLLVGLFWALWHLPLFYMVGTFQFEQHIPYIPFLVNLISISFIYTYLFIKTKYKVFSAVLFHWFYTYLIQVVSTEINRTEISKLYNWLEIVPALLIAGVFIYLLRNEKKLN